MVTNTGKVVEQKAVGICSTTFTRETLLNNLAKSPSTMNQPYRFNVATYFCVLTGCGVFDWCRWTFNVEKYVEKPPPELRDFAHILPTTRVVGSGRWRVSRHLGPWISKNVTTLRTHPPGPSKFTPFCFGGFSLYEDILYLTTRCGLFREQI